MALVGLWASAPADAAPGNLDPTFSRDGLITTAATDGMNGQFVDIEVLPDGRLVALGESGAGTSDRGVLVIARYEAHGALDLSFGSDGLARFDPGGPDRLATGLAVDPNGRILIGGWVREPEPPARVFVARLTADGELDTSFGGTGIVTTGLTGPGADVIATDDGRILVGGAIEPNRMAIISYGDDGTVDTSFADGGQATATFDEDVTPIGVPKIAEGPQGSLVMAGTVSIYDPIDDYPYAHFGIARFANNGKVDKSLGGDGTATAHIPGNDMRARALAVSTDGEILVAGYMYDASEDYPTFYAVLARFTADGAPDVSFASDGWYVASAAPYHQNYFQDVTTVPNGHIVVAGGTYLWEGRFGRMGYSDFWIQMLNDSGTLDPAFGQGGQVLTDFEDNEDRAMAIVQPSETTIRVAGSATVSPSYNWDLALAGYTLAPGWRDGDADRVLDELDRCPTVFGNLYSGCPIVRRTASLEYLRRPPRLHGELAGRRLECTDGGVNNGIFRVGRVHLVRDRSGPDPIVDSTRLTAGGFTFEVPDRAGRFYAVAVRFVDPESGVCRRAVSPSVDVP